MENGWVRLYKTRHYELPTDPYNVIAIIKDKLTEQELASHQSLVFNLTGGNKGNVTRSLSRSTTA